jgi:uncharacterized repeat protein (TIGR03803 family)
MWLTRLRRRWFRRSPSCRRTAQPRPASLRVRQLEGRLIPSLTTIASFNDTNGSFPQSGVIIDGSGSLYGTTRQGGASSDGTIFEVAAGSATITTLASFNGTDGKFPDAGLLMDGSGNLYGTTFEGGGSSAGTVFELAAGSGTITTLASFTGSVEFPTTGLAMDAIGNLYGTTPSGGASGDGSVWELAAGSGTVTTLASFNITNGQSPQASPMLDSAGNLYGTTSGGGANSDGTVFEVAQGSGTITTLASFSGTDGKSPQAALIMDSAGNLFGTTALGGATQSGTVFEVVHGSGTITLLGSFDGTNGTQPEAALIMDSRGNLYGTTNAGGTDGEGAVFMLAPGGTITALASCTLSTGQIPWGSLAVDASGNLYGTTQQGGASVSGTVFEVPGAAAPTDQWTGANSAADNNWSDGANWSTGSSPNPGQTAVFTNNASVQSFTSTVDTAFTNAVAGLSIDGTWGGTVTVNSPLAVSGNLTMASGTFGGSGAVSIGGAASQWTGGTIDLGSGGFTNTGTITADTTGGNLALSGAGTLTSTGTISQAGKNSLVLENSAVLSNTPGATFDLTDNGGITQSGGGTFTNAGTLEKTGGTGTSTIATTSLGNAGTVAVGSGTLDIAAGVAQVSGKTLTAGAWDVTGTGTVHAKLDITSAGSLTTLGAGAQVTLDGANATFTNLRGLRTIDKGAGLSLLGGAAFTTMGTLTDKGALTLGPASTLTVSGSFTQATTGVLTIDVGGTNTAPTFGQLVSTTGTVALAGSLKVTSTVVPAVGSSFEVLDNEGDTAVSGIFKALPQGATFKVKVGARRLTFQVTYAGTDADGSQNVILTRVS